MSKVKVRYIVELPKLIYVITTRSYEAPFQQDEMEVTLTQINVDDIEQSLHDPVGYLLKLIVKKLRAKRTLN